MIFKAREAFNDIEEIDNCFKVANTDDIQVENGWKRVKDASLNDKLLISDGTYEQIKKIESDNIYYYLYV